MEMIFITSSGGRHFRILPGIIAVCLLFAVAGCEEVNKVVKDVRSEVSGPPVSTPQPETHANSSQDGMAPASGAPAAGPTAAEIVARFQMLSSFEITDADLAQVCSSPEAGNSITKIDLTGNRHVSHTGLAQLASLQNLTSLSVASTDLHPEVLSAIGSIPSLHEVLLSSTKTDDSVIAKLTAIPGIHILDLTATLITPASGTSLSQMRELNVLKLTSTNCNDQLVSMLHDMPLRELRLDKTQITGAAIPGLLRITTLEYLNVDFDNVLGTAWKGASRSNLKILSVSTTPFGLEGFQAIKGMNSLEVLNVYAAGLVEHKAADVFGTFPKLRVLNAGANAVTDVGMGEFFKGLKNLEELHLGSNRKISDQGLAALVGLKKLRFLDVRDTMCGQAGALALKAKLPDCRIQTNSGEY